MAPATLGTIIFHKFNRFQQLEKEATENKANETKPKKQIYTQYETNRNLMSGKKRRFTV